MCRHRLRQISRDFYCIFLRNINGITGKKLVKKKILAHKQSSAYLYYRVFVLVELIAIRVGANEETYSILLNQSKIYLTDTLVSNFIFFISISIGSGETSNDLALYALMTTPSALPPKEFK